MKPVGERPRMEELTQLYSPRTTLKNILESQNYLLSNLTLYIDRYTIQNLKREFDKRQGSLSLVDFVLVLREQFAAWQPEPAPYRKKDPPTVEQLELSKALKKQLPNREIRLSRCLL